MGIYVNNQKIYVVKGTSLNTSIALNAGPEHTVVEEWDYCGGATTSTINLTVVVPVPPTVSIIANPSTVTSGSSSTLSVTATGATQVTVTGTNGSTYALSATGGRLTVTPTATTTYTASATGSMDRQLPRMP